VAAKVQYPFRLQALGPRRRNIVFRPRRTRNPYVWSARFAFSVPGRWEIRVTNYYFGEQCIRTGGCGYDGPRLVIRIRS
jgi:hypothetical protein